MEVRNANDAPDGWDSYVAKHPRGSAYHRYRAVEIGRSAFGLRTEYVTAHDGSGALIGVLPLVEQASLVFGRYLNSLPYFNYGGILADSEQVARALADRAAEVAARRRVDHVELRQSDPVAALELAERRDKVAMILELPDSEDLLAKQLGSKLRSQIRRAEREEPEVIWGGSELLPEFYRVFSVCMHGLGTPVYSRKFFDVVYKALSDVIAVVVVRAGGRVEAAAITVRHGRRIEVPWAAATTAAKRTAINMRLYWEMLRRAIEQEATAFDFGRCTEGSGTHRFKAQWGAQPHQLYWYYWLREGNEVPQLSNTNPRYTLAVSAWRRMPLWCANLLGPMIARNLP